MKPATDINETSDYTRTTGRPVVRILLSTSSVAFASDSKAGRGASPRSSGANKQQNDGMTVVMRLQQAWRRREAPFTRISS
jgi:hypothetical protein